ncbi:transposase [Chryseobacterium sp. MIQD13]|uniref:transposase n=1 Tax=Chryseobacterium sp. MIQD13 TaxID=3422310 RepID=UPI003D2CCBCD
MNFKNIHIGNLINERVTESEIEISRICNFFKCSVKEIQTMYDEKYLDTGTLLKWCKLLEYDFFRLYSQHLILYAPPTTGAKKSSNDVNPGLPQFRKNLYTKEIIEFILEMINTEEKTKYQIIEDYKIPKTTLYKWIEKYR